MKKLYGASSIILAFSIWYKIKRNSTALGTSVGGVEFTPKLVCWPHVYNGAIASFPTFTAASAFTDC